MAKKSKTQRAKASANRQAKKLAAQQQEQAPVVEEEAPKSKFALKKSAEAKSQNQQKPAPSSSTAKTEKTPKKKRFQFLRDVKAEMKRVTWPTKKDVLQWTGVVLVALVFFSLFCIVFDDWVVTPILYGISNLGGLING